MSLLKGLVSLVLVYCFLLSITPINNSALSTGVRVPASAGLSPQPHSPTEVGTLTPFDRAYNFLSSLFGSKRTFGDEDDADKEEGLRFRLSEAPEQPEAKPANKVANATVLSDAETQAILNRLPPIKAELSDEAEFALREKSLPPPRTGATVMQPFPAASEMAPPEQTTAGPLEVVRYSPEGDVPIAPNLSVTFSQPMVAITSQEEAAENVPVKLSPQPPGKWHWIGTKTLLFEPEIRFPMATQYSIIVPAGTRSANGGVLASAKTWTFATPAPKVKDFYPARATVQRRDVLMFAEFDQRIDPAAVLRNIRIEAGSTRLAARLVTREEIEKDKDVRQLTEHAEKDRWLVFRAIDSSGKTENALPAGANIDVSILAGTLSAEGPRTTKEAQNFPFMTFGPLRIIAHNCGYDKRCRPSDAWTITFSNPIDPQTFDDSKIKVDPRIEASKTSVYSSALYLNGSKKGHTTYHVTFDKSIKDILLVKLLKVMLQSSLTLAPPTLNCSVLEMKSSCSIRLGRRVTRSIR